MDTSPASARFEHPPVRQVELTVYFDAVESLQVTHFSSLREQWRAEVPGDS